MSSIDEGIKDLFVLLENEDQFYIEQIIEWRSGSAAGKILHYGRNCLQVNGIMFIKNPNLEVKRMLVYNGKVMFYIYSERRVANDC